MDPEEPRAAASGMTGARAGAGGDQASAPTPFPFSAAAISSRIAGSSIVAGIDHGSPSAVFFTVPRRILPGRVFGRRTTVIASLKAGTGPNFSGGSPTSPRASTAGAAASPDFRATKPHRY